MAPEGSLTPRRVFAFMAMVFGMFMAILDIQIVAASLSEIQAGLSASQEEVAWVQTAYLIAEVVMIPLSGILGRILSTRVLFTVSALGFTAASFLCSTATTIDQMMIYRAIQGFIGGGMIPSVFAAAFTIFPPSKQNIVSPLIGLIATLAPTIGPTIGGYLSDTYSWHWLFLVNVPPGIFVAFAAWNLIDFDQPEPGLLKQFDWWGLIGMAGFLGGLEYVLEEGPQHDWLSDGMVRTMAVISVVGCVTFFVRTFTVKLPVVDFSAFRNVNFAMGCVFSFVLGMGLYGLTYLYPVYLAEIRGYDSLMIGETMFVSGLAMFCTAPFAGMLSSKLDPRIMLIVGFLGFALSCWQLTYMTDQWDFWELLVPQILRGMSLMLCMVPINNLALGTLSPMKLKGASGLYNLMRNLGGAVGLAIINTLLIKRGTLHYERLSEGLNWANAQAMGTLHTIQQGMTAAGVADPRMGALAQLSGMVRKQATVMSFIDIFTLLTALFAALSLLAIAMQKPAPRGAGAGGGH
ncbi:DHA2 family efflux MFS transporter permease subunit [Solirhodobacter olei]|uniref:DHA2 family efflux MFS transporter permease subunit n=1 Tax=Solirhodobacter olei TaxID=2493082 RepID=UPI000FDC4C19|nr:DHA2 family efflux MFS transporter permease subunit [Solirhodobacter olei]